MRMRRRTFRLLTALQSSGTIDPFPPPTPRLLVLTLLKSSGPAAHTAAIYLARAELKRESHNSVMISMRGLGF